MMDQNIEEKKTVGLLPMGLAETNANERNGPKCYPIFQKVLAVLFLMMSIVVFYLLILRLLETNAAQHNTDIIVISGLHEAENMTILKDNTEVFLQVKNISDLHLNKRKKREAISLSKHYNIQKTNHVKFKDNQIQKAKKLIAEHDVLCNEENHKDICRELIMKIKSLTENNFSNQHENNEGIRDHKNVILDVEKNKKHILEINPTDVSKRDIHIHSSVRPTKSVVSLNNEHDINYGMSEQYNIPHHSIAYSRDITNPPLTDTCLLARLMRQSYPNFQGEYDTPNQEYPNIPLYSSQFPSGFPTSYLQTREVETHKHRLHPQDIEIAMNFIAPKLEASSKEASTNSSINEIECPIGSISCDNGNKCVSEKDWCDGNVDCDDVSDESRCSCKSRVDESRICDGYFDCPFGEDEMGCYGCSEGTFSCEDVNMNSQSTCYSKEQRCNNVPNCPNHKDEIDCSMLAPSLHKKPLFSISNTEGYLYRNFKGNWYAVCNNPYMWAHDACRRETGLIIRPPFIQVLQIDPLIKVNYISTAPGGLIHTSNTCMNSSAVYVTCPDLLCGTRVLTAAQLLRENAAIENHLFGRNKRFLQRPYPVTFYDRTKRYVTNKDIRSEILLNYLDDIRKKRAESRVVGGRPSQPAAWPWMVALYRDGMFHCGGVIINQNWIMSAAHCVHKFWQHYYEVQVGMLRRFSFSPQEQNHRVTHVIVNKNYDQEDMKNDLSLLRVKPAIQFSRWVRPICLPSPEVAGSDWMWGPKPGTICTAVGWGATVEKGPDPDHMREVEIPVWESCKHEEDQAGKEICAGLVEGGKDACQGDSGGPLLCRNPVNAQQWYVAGIVSHGDGCARKGEPGVYTRISLFVQWIRYHTSTKTLPLIQPKQECPGFRCDSGISKCLPKKRMCDKIIDCLDGEDEFNCDSEKLPEESVTNLIPNPFTQESNISADRKSKSSDDINLMPNKNKTSIEKSDENIIDINNNHEISKNDLKFDENINSTQTATIPSLSTDSNLSENIEGTSSMKHIVLDDSIKDIKNPIINENKSFKVLENNTTPNYNKNAENNNIISSNSESNEDTSTVKNRKDNIQESSTSSIINVTKNNTNKHPLPLEVTTEFHTNNDFALNDTINTTTTTIASIITTSKKELLNIDGELENIINLHDMGLEERDINLVKPIIDLDMLGDDIKHASTIEISNANSQENVNAEDFDGNITVDPLTEEFESFMKTEKPKSEPESDSFVLKRDPNSEKSNTTIKEIDIATTKTLSSTPLPSTAIKQEDELITKAPENNIDQKHNPLAIEELNLNTVTIDDTVNNDINIKDNVNQEIIKFEPANTTILEDQVISETQIDRKVNFQQLLDTNDSLNKIESIIMPSELEPAKKRKKHLTISDFQCRRIFQIVPFIARCDRKADCEDGTDELGCNCLDYLTTFDNKLICDGNFDCADGQDETDCYSCEEDHFLCKGSEVCLASKYVCDGKPHCPLGEDEIDCFTLSNGNHIVYDLNGRPEVTLEGYLTERHDKNWHIVCEEDMSIHQQEESASHICRYLGFSSANRYLIKHINVKEHLNIIEDNRGKRDINLKVPVHFAFKSNNNNELQTIEDPKIIKEECVPNITKTCMALYIYCDHSLFTNFNINHFRNNKEVKDVSNHWPWIAKLYMDGKYKCTGVLIDLSWVLISHLCLQGVTLGYDFITVLLGSHKTLDSAVGPYEQAYQVDAKKDLYRSKVMLLHLKQPAVYSAMVKPMVVMSSHFEDNKNKKCVAIGQDKHNKTFSVFLKETDDCDLHHRCFIRHENSSTCHTNEHNWAGIISCHSKQGWYPAASFVQIDDVCAFSEKILATDIGNIKHEIKYYEEKPLSDSAQEKFFDRCDGVRCQRGSCIKLRSVCDGVTDCEDGIDESKESCKKKYDICSRDPHYRGCDCLVGQLKCHNGLCIPKELFKDGNDDCGDGTDEPKQTMCSDYLRRVMPSRLCDGILHCHDKSDEDPMFCKCFAKEAYKCSGMSRNEDYCVAMDMVCDGVPDCPGGEDENACIGLSAPQGTPHGNGEVIIRSHGVWYSKCYPTKNHTKSELESICRELGFISGHAKQLSSLKVTHPHNNVVIDTFSDVTLNNNTIIKLRNSHAPIARAIADEKENCYPVFIECL